MSADGAADLRRRAAASARTRHGGEAVDAAKEMRWRTKPAPRLKFPDSTLPCAALLAFAEFCLDRLRKSLQTCDDFKLLIRHVV